MSKKDYKPGRIATLDEMLAVAKDFAADEAKSSDMGSLKVRHVCAHECRCECHTSEHIHHALACCQRCDKCKHPIKYTELSDHQKRCHPGKKK